MTDRPRRHLRLLPFSLGIEMYQAALLDLWSDVAMAITRDAGCVMCCMDKPEHPAEYGDPPMHRCDCACHRTYYLLKSAGSI